MKLDPRLQAIANYVDEGDVVADIGTDHAYIPIYLIEKKKCEKVFATDINEGPLENAGKIVAGHGLSHSIELRLGNGLKPVVDEKVDKIIIAGMGGLLIRDIIEGGNALIERNNARLVLQPMVAQAELREWLRENGFNVVSEKLARDRNKYYEIMLAEKGKDTSEVMVKHEIGGRLVEEKDPLLGDFLMSKIRKYEIILDNIRENAFRTDDLNKRMNDIAERLEGLREVLKAI